MSRMKVSFWLAPANGIAQATAGPRSGGDDQFERVLKVANDRGLLSE